MGVLFGWWDCVFNWHPFCSKHFFQNAEFDNQLGLIHLSHLGRLWPFGRWKECRDKEMIGEVGDFFRITTRALYKKTCHTMLYRQYCSTNEAEDFP